jgi:competence protein ComEC
VGGMITRKVTRFRAYQLGTSGSSFSYFVDGHFTLLEGRMTDISRRTLISEMDKCDVQNADVLHMTSWDSDHCSASECRTSFN